MLMKTLNEYVLTIFSEKIKKYYTTLEWKSSRVTKKRRYHEEEVNSKNSKYQEEQQQAYHDK